MKVTLVFLYKNDKKYKLLNINYLKDLVINTLKTTKRNKNSKEFLKLEKSIYERTHKPFI